MKELRDILEMLSFVAQIISFPVAAGAIFLSRLESKASRDLQIALTLSDSFRKYWESGWFENLREIREFQKNNEDSELPKDLEKQLRFMLNWIDWLGSFIMTKSFSNPNTILSSINLRLSQIINAGQSIIERDIEKYDVDFWSGVITVAKLLEIDWIEQHRLKLNHSNFHFTR